MKNHPLDSWKNIYPEKFVSEEKIFSKIRRGDRIFISTGCGQPQYLVNAMTNYVTSHPKAFAEAEIMQVWTLGVSPYINEKFNYNFRHNSFFVGDNTREYVNTGLADYTPIFLSHVPQLMRTGRIPIEIALIQTSLPDRNGYVSLGISVDITKSAIENAACTIAQINKHMPRIHGNTFIHMDEIDYIVPRDEPLIQYDPRPPDGIAEEIGKYVSRIVNDGDTIQLGYGSLPNAILHNMGNKKDLGVHTELLTDSMVELIKKGVINNSRKSRKRGKSVAAFCMGTAETYEFLHDNPVIDFNPIDYTNNPVIISQIENMTAINSALQIDLTGQSTSESIGGTFYSGIGGHADFMRGAIMAPGGKTILVIQSTAKSGEVSRIVPFLDSGAGVTLNRGDIHYIVSEYGIAYIHGKNIRERAMDLIAIAHPKFRSGLIEEAKRNNIIYRDQAFIPGKKGEYPEHLEVHSALHDGTEVKIRPVKINDEPIIKKFFYSLSDKSIQRRFMSYRTDITHDLRQDFTVIDYTREMTILAIIEGEEKKETLLGMGQSIKSEDSLSAEIAFAIRDDYQNQGIGTKLLSYLIILAQRDGLHGFTADVLLENRAMIKVFENLFPDMEKRIEDNVISCTMRFKSHDEKN
jgi:acyl-CoA hydrolase/RimJ/RimL family protein N-acetyltransferase